MSNDTLLALVIAIISLTFYAGGFVRLTRNHIAHLVRDFKAMQAEQRLQGQRLERIETIIISWREKQ